MKAAVFAILALLFVVLPVLAEEPADPALPKPAAERPPLSPFSIGSFLSYWHIDDLDDFDGEGLFGGGVSGRYRIFDALAVELRASGFGGGFSEDVYIPLEGWYENDTSLFALALEAGVIGILPLGEQFHLYGGPGIGYYIFDGESSTSQGPWEWTLDLDFDDEPGAYLLFGAGFQLARNAALFFEGKYTWVESSLTINSGDLGIAWIPAAVSVSRDFDFGGLALQAGMIFTF